MYDLIAARTKSHFPEALRALRGTVPPLTRALVIRALGETGRQEALDPLRVALHNPDAAVRSAAAGALGALGFDSAGEALARATFDPHWRVRLKAAEAIGQLSLWRHAEHLARLGFHLRFFAVDERHHVIEDVQRRHARIPAAADRLHADDLHGFDPEAAQGSQRHRHRHAGAVGIRHQPAAAPAEFLALHLNQLQHSPELREHLRQKGRARVLAHFTHQQVAEATVRVYGEMTIEGERAARQ